METIGSGMAHPQETMFFG